MASTADLDIETGTVRGARDGVVTRWRSIPYAAPPTGGLRFAAPHPAASWSGVRDATQFGNAAMQKRSGAQLGPRTFQPVNEDCLTINVTAPTSPAPTPRPVIVFFHGGGYLFGTSALGLYSGTHLAAGSDVVVVSCNYRLGAFGYVAFGETNLGLRDQVAALEWVQRNISAFGGDPGNVTIMGQSAGANAVTTLLATPAAAGLFHRAIAHSPPADWALSDKEAARFAQRCRDRLGEDPHTADVHAIRRATAKEVGVAIRERPGFIATAPVVDGDYLPEAPLAALAAGRAHAVPLLIGGALDEGTLFAKLLDQLPTNPERLERLFTQAGDGARARIVAAYPDFPASAVRVGGDYVFRRPTVAAARGHSGHAPTYHFRYDFAPRAMRLTGYGATHGSDLFGIFGFGETPAGRALTAAGGRRGLRNVTRLMQENWVTFARNGSPTDEWPAYTESAPNTLIIDTLSRVAPDPDTHLWEAWQDVRSATLG